MVISVSCVCHSFLLLSAPGIFEITRLCLLRLGLYDRLKGGLGGSWEGGLGGGDMAVPMADSC